jgi:hypothetical protein
MVGATRFMKLIEKIMKELIKNDWFDKTRESAIPQSNNKCEVCGEKVGNAEDGMMEHYTVCEG